MESMTPDRKTITMSDGPSRGKKQCPGCKRYIGVRAGKCNCGYEFEKKSNSEPKHSEPHKRGSEPIPEPKKNLIRPGCGYLIAPGGPSLEAGMKVKLEAQGPDDYSGFSHWADRMLGMGQANGFNYGPMALRYFLRFYFDINSPEYRVAVATLNQWSLEYFIPTEKPVVVSEITQ